MASIYVDSAGSNTAPYDTKAKAATLLLTATAAAAAGDTIYVLQAHNQARSAVAQTYSILGTRANPTRILCITGASAEGSETDADLAFMTNTISTNTGVGITFNNGSADGCVYMYGLNFQCGTSTSNSSITICGTSTNGEIIAENCNLALGHTNTGGRIIVGTDPAAAMTVDQTVRLRNTSISLASTSQSFINSGNLVWEGSGRAALLGGSSVPSVLVSNAQRAKKTILRDLDASNLTSGTVVGFFNNSSGYCEIRRVNTGGATALPAMTTQSMYALADRVGPAGTANYVFNYSGWGGSHVSQTTIVRTGGATADDLTRIGWRVTTDANPSKWEPFRCQELTRWNTSTGSKTLTIYGVYNGAALPTNAQMWVDVDYPDSGSDSGGSIARSTFVGIINTSASNLTADTSDWDDGLTARANSTAYTATTSVFKTASNPGRVFFCTTSGTTAASEPASPGYNTAADGDSVTDGTAVFRAGWRFKTTVTFNQAVVGRFSAFIQFGVASADFVIDPYLGGLA